MNVTSTNPAFIQIFNYIFGLSCIQFKKIFYHKGQNVLTWIYFSIRFDLYNMLWDCVLLIALPRMLDFEMCGFFVVIFQQYFNLKDTRSWYLMLSRNENVQYYIPVPPCSMSEKCFWIVWSSTLNWRSRGTFSMKLYGNFWRNIKC